MLNGISKNLKFFFSDDPVTYSELHQHNVEYEVNILTHGICKYLMANGDIVDLIPGSVLVMTPAFRHNLVKSENAEMLGLHFNHNTAMMVTEDIDSVPNSMIRKSESIQFYYGVKSLHKNSDYQNIISEFERKPGYRIVYDWSLFISIQTNLQSARQEFTNARHLYPICLISIALEIIVASLRVLCSPINITPESATEKRVLDVKSWLDNNVAASFTEVELAEKAFISPDHFTRVFSKLIGITPKKYIIAKRLEMAAQLLRTTTNSISDIAMICGFSHHAHFTRQFNIFFKLSPHEYRKINSHDKMYVKMSENIK